jgi:GT2 family glycosyltransferase
MLSLVSIDTDDSVTEQHWALNQDCLQVRNPQGTPWLYLRLPVSATGVRGSVTVEFTLLCDFRPKLFNFGTKVWLEYDSHDDSVDLIPGQPGAFKRTPPISVKKTNRFETLSFHIPDPQFTNRVNGADFRIVADRPTAKPMYISQVTVKHGDQLVGQENGASGDLSNSTSPPLIFEQGGPFQCSIIIPMHNKVEYTLQCLKYLQQNTPAIYEVIVVDDASDAGDLKRLRAVEGITVVEHHECQGFARACSSGAAVARSDYLLFLNNDTIPLEGWLEPMLQTLEHNPKVGIVGSKLIFPGSSLIQHTGMAFDRHGLPYHLGLHRDMTDSAAAQGRFVVAVTGACFMTRKTLYDQLHGFDEVFRNGFEDVDYCLRAAELRYQTWYCAESELYHYESVTDGRINDLQETNNRNIYRARWLTPKRPGLEAEGVSGVSQLVVARSREAVLPKVIAFHQPQFHKITEKDQSWVARFTEWINRRKAKTLFSKRSQPGEPGEHVSSAVNREPLFGSRLLNIIDDDLGMNNPAPESDQSVDYDLNKLSTSLLRLRFENFRTTVSRELTPIDVAIVLHVYYLDIFQELLGRLGSISCVPFTLYVTTTEELELEVRLILEARGFANFKLYAFENRGRDVLPFLKVMPDVIEAGHQFVVKGHTKKSPHFPGGQRWRDALYTGLFENDGLEKGLEQLLINPKLGIYGPSGHLAPMDLNLAPSLNNLRAVADQLGISEEQMMGSSFVAGTMFISRVSALRPLLSIGFKDDDFENEAGQIDGTLAHCIERAISLSALVLDLEVGSNDGAVIRHYEFPETISR